ncbi:MAG: hypothetical protein ACPG5U_02155 [Planktomarina sp.]
MKDFFTPNLRPPSHVMRLSQMGAMFPTRISFLRVLVRALAAENAKVERSVWDMDADGYGQALYTVSLGGHTYSLFAISQALDPSQRTDRVIANAWDAAFVLYDGVPDADERARLAANAPLQEGGRYGPRDLCLSRANKSVRLFKSVGDALRNDTLPMMDILNIGYLMRTTAVYGNGKFGLADRHTFCTRPHMDCPFMAEMLTVWLIRGFTHDLVEHVGGAEMPPPVKRALGVGNSTGLGMAPFLVSHPGLLHAWISTRETALARVLEAEVNAEQATNYITLARRAMQHLLEWNVPDPEHQDRIVGLRRDWATMLRGLTGDTLTGLDALRRMIEQADTPDFEELLIAWAIEGAGDLVDDLTDQLAKIPETTPDLTQDCTALQATLHDIARFATTTDFNAADQTAQFWYVSQSKLEPRLGNRHAEEGADWESPLDIARRMAELGDDLQGATGPVWAFLAHHPQHRMAVERLQLMAALPYSEIQDNLIADTTHPINMLRCKLSFFGASKFDPKSKLWTRISLGQGAPLAKDIEQGTMTDQVWLAAFGQ